MFLWCPVDQGHVCSGANDDLASKDITKTNDDEHNHWRRYSWWRHHMETFPALLALCEGIPPVTGGSKASQWRQWNVLQWN